MNSPRAPGGQSGNRQGIPRLPQPPEVILGRERDRRIAVELLRSELVRLLTITGTGGMGKTTLALAVAHDLQSSFRDGILFVSLAHLDNPDLVLPAIANELDLRGHAAESLGEQIQAALWNREMLLVLDNLEQVRAAAPDISTILQTCPDVTILATSRIPLNITFEQQYALLPLTSPDSVVESIGTARQFPSVALFEQRARARRFDFELTPANIADVVAICRRVDGIPLAIELAAARIKILTPAALLARLETGIDVLSGGSLDQPDRLRTVHAAIQWSYGLLTPAEQTTFARLAIFNGGFTEEAAIDVTDVSGVNPEQIRADIENLVESNLLHVSHMDTGDTRFGMYETIREFGLGQLRANNELAICQERHADWFGRFVEQAWNNYAFRIDVRTWFDRFEADQDNLRAAIAWMVSHESGDAALFFMGRVSIFMYARGYLLEGRSLLEAALAHVPGGSDAARASALYGLGSIGHLLDEERAIPILTESAQLAHRADDTFGQYLALFMLGVIAEDTGDFATAQDHMQRALTLAEELQQPGLIAHATTDLGMIAWGRGDHEIGIELGERALAQQEAIDDQMGIALSSSFLGWAEADRGNMTAAERYMIRSFEIRLHFRNWTNLANCLDNIAFLAMERDQVKRAIRLFASAEAIRKQYGHAMREPERSWFMRAYATLQTKVSAQVWQDEWGRGLGMSRESAIAEAHAVTAEPLSVANAYDLTQRELDVLQLLVAGQTDREIAEALFISPRTAQGHVSHIFDKIGVNNRAAAVALALQENLLEL